MGVGVMMIEEKCKCGAELKIVDDSGVYIKFGGDPNEFGERFMWQVQLRTWRQKHKNCMTLKTS